MSRCPHQSEQKQDFQGMTLSFHLMFSRVPESFLPLCESDFDKPQATPPLSVAAL